MPQSHHRHRVAALAVGLILGAPLLAASPAGAEPVESRPQVTFEGSGLPGEICEANPSASSVTVVAETTLQVVNRTGYQATLLLDGNARGEVGEGGTVEVLFHRGPVALALRPHCVLAQQKSVQVWVINPEPPADDMPSPAGPSGPADGNDGGWTPTHQPSPGGGAGLGPATPPRGTPGHGGHPRYSGGDNGRPGDDPGGRDRPQTGGVPPNRPGGAATAAPAGAEPPQVPPVDLTADQDAVVADGDGLLDDGEAAAEPMAAVEPITNKGPTGLLAVIAIVCILGVSVGAIRAILAQRASRAAIA